MPKPKPSLTINIAKNPPEDSTITDSNNQGLTDEVIQTPSLNLKLNLTTCNFDDFEKIDQLGFGNGGVVSKVIHKPTGNIMAQKLIHLEVKREIQRRIITELKLLEQCQHPNIVGYYGSFHWQANNEIVINMEHMDGRSLDVILSHAGRLPMKMISEVHRSVLDGLMYLHEELQVMHRDIKPSNMLVNSNGEVKLCDFGVSAQLINSIANSFVGTRSYMAPERLMGNPQYKIKSDVWSLGISLLELALGVFPIPYPSENEIENIMTSPCLDVDNQESVNYFINTDRESQTRQARPMAIFELLDHIVKMGPPELQSVNRFFDDDFIVVVIGCLQGEMEKRPSYIDLKGHETLGAFYRNNLNMSQRLYVKNWVSTVIKHKYDRRAEVQMDVQN